MDKTEDEKRKEMKERINVTHGSNRSLVQMEVEGDRLEINILLRQSEEHPWLEYNHSISLIHLDELRRANNLKPFNGENENKGSVIGSN